MVPGLALLREANKLFPETRIVWAAIAVVAALAIMDSFRLGWTVAALGAIVVLILLILFFIVSGICAYLADPTKGNSLLKYPAIVLVWAFTLGICAFVGLSMSCFFIGKPKTLVELFTFGDEVVVHEPGGVTQNSPAISPLTPITPPYTPNNGGVPRLVNADAVSRCLNAIDASRLSVSEVQEQARQCLRAR